MADGPHRLLGGVVRSESSLDEHAGRRRAAPFKIVLHDDLPWLRLGGAYFLMAAVCSLPMVGRGLIINTHLRLRPDISTAFYMATWLPSLAAPIVGRLTDLLPPSRRKIAAAALVVEAAFQALYAAGLVDSLGKLYAVAVPIALAHVAAQACVDGILVSGRGGGETATARARQGAMATFSVAGDIVACLISLLIQLADGAHAGSSSGQNGTACSAPPSPPTLAAPPSSGWSTSLVLASFAVTSIFCLMAAVLVYLLPRHGSSSRNSELLEPVAGSLLDGQVVFPEPADAPAAAPTRPVDGNAFIYQDVPVPMPTSSCCERVTNALGGRHAILAAAVAVTYMLSPTSSDALTAFIYQDVPMPTSLLTAQQMSGLFGTLLGGCAVWWLDWPLSRLLPLGAVATSLGSISGLWLVAARDSIAACQPWGYASLVLQPFVGGFLGRVGIFPLFALGAAASTRSREGGAYGLVMAAQAAAGEASALLSVALIKALRIGAADAPGQSWAHLPHLMALCAVCKLVSGPLAVLVWRAGRRHVAVEASAGEQGE